MFAGDIFGFLVFCGRLNMYFIHTLNITCMCVYRRNTEENYVFVMYTIKFMGSTHPEKMLCNFEKKCWWCTRVCADWQLHRLPRKVRGPEELIERRNVSRWFDHHADDEEGLIDQRIDVLCQNFWSSLWPGHWSRQHSLGLIDTCLTRETVCLC